MLPIRPAVLFVAGFAGLLAAVPVRTAELWRHLAAGRDLLRGGRPSGTWLFDLQLYLTEGLAGGWGLAAGKTAAVALMAAVMARAAGGGLLAAAGVTLAVLACGPRLVSLNTIPLLLLAVLVDRLRAAAPRWQLVAVAVVWANVDRWVWVGVGVTALTLLGRVIDARRTGAATGLGRAAGTVLVLAVAAVLNPAVLTGREGAFDFGGGAGLAARSPFHPDYREAVSASPAGMAYYPLLVLSAGSFLLGGWRWERFLPWAALAAASAAQARLVPAFAVAAGPVLVWNVAARPGRPRFVVQVAAGVAAAGLLAAAWPGWLLGPPYESRRLAVDLPAAVEQSAAAVAALGAPGRTLHLTPDTLHGFAWFLPGERGQLADPAGDAVKQFLVGDGADRAVVLLTGPTALSPAARLLTAADPRARVHFGGGAVVVARTPAASPVDLDRVGFGPSAAVPPLPPAEWWTPFVRPRSVWSADRGEAAAAGALADAAGSSALARHAVEWEAVQAAGLVGMVGPADLAVRLTLLAPPGDGASRPPPVTVEVLGLFQRFAYGRDDVPAGAAYAAVRAARRAVAADPAAAAAHHLLGEAYLRLLGGTRERAWGADVPALVELRRTQAATALERAVRLNPLRTDTHRLLARLYRDMNYLDLAADHLRAAGETADDLAKEVDGRRATLAAEAGGARVLDRAKYAVQAGLGGEALRLLLGSDVAAFGAGGVELELVLLSRTGRAADVLTWATPDYQQPLGTAAFHRLRAAAAAAVGDYPLADAELAELGGAAVPGAVWARVVGDRLLGEVAGGDLLPQIVWRGIIQSDFELTVARLVRDEDDLAEVSAVRGLLALEAGDVAAARARFREARGTGRPLRTGRRMGRDGLEWVGP